MTNKYNKFLTKFKICHIIILEGVDSGMERGFLTMQNLGYAKAFFEGKIDFFPPKTIHNPWVLVLSVRKSPNSQLTPIKNPPKTDQSLASDRRTI